MDYLDSLNPGEHENAFYVKSDIADDDRIGVPSPYDSKFYVRVWDPEQKRHVGKFSERGQYDILG